LNFIFIAFSLIASTILSILIMRNRKSKWLGMLSAFVINMLILGSAYWFLYNIDEESRLFGIDFHSRYTLVMSIPVITLINVIILSLDRKRGVRAKVKF
jgi:hypothetical protein